MNVVTCDLVNVCFRCCVDYHVIRTGSEYVSDKHEVCRAMRFSLHYVKFMENRVSYKLSSICRMLMLVVEVTWKRWHRSG